MELSTFKSWLDTSGQAGGNRDAQAAADFLADDGAYQITLWLAPMRGRSAILEYWSHVTETERDVHCAYEVLAVTKEIGSPEGGQRSSSFLKGLQTKLDGIFLISPDAGGRCKSLREWRHKEQSNHDEQDG